jgi:ribosomal protein L37AE/L43A
MKQHLIRRLYENDAAGIQDEDLLNEVGWGLLARCESFIAAVEATHGRVLCPTCASLVLHNGRPEGVLHCSNCGWEVPWKAYQHTFQHKQLSGAAEVLALFQNFIDCFPTAQEPKEKILLIDGLIHGFHWYIRFGNTRAAGVNLIEGALHEVVDFLDSLSVGPGSTPGIQQTREEWLDKINRISDLWKDERLRRRPGEQGKI